MKWRFFANYQPRLNPLGQPGRPARRAELLLLYNGSRVHNAKHQLVGTCQCDWAFRLVFVLVQERPRSIVGHVEVNANGCQPDRLPASVGADGVHLQLRN